MVYTAHFGLRETPFRATPDPRFFYSNPAYREAYATLLYGVREHKGFIVLTGEVGTGKTTLLRRLMDELGPPVRFVLFYNTTLTFDETVEFICADLGLAVDGSSRVQRLQRLNDLLVAEARQGGNVVLLIDEAQNLQPDVLENLRLMSNLETATEKLLQIVLVGQPELDTKLADPALRQVAQRVAIRYRLEPLPHAEIERFIDHRLRLCGRARRDLFTAGAVRRIAAYSGGIPRFINILCDNALLLAYGTDATRVTGAMLDEVVADLRLRSRASVAAPDRRAHGRGRAVSRAGARRWLTVGLAVLSMAGVAAALLRGSPLAPATRDVSSRPDPPLAAVASTTPAGEPVVTPAPLRPPGALPPDRPTDVEAPGPAGRPPERRPPLELPARPPSASHLPGSGWGTVVPAGRTISEIVSRRYGEQRVLALDLVAELNPHIADLDRVLVGERLWMPALTLTTLTRRQPDGSYHLIVASAPGPQAANRLAERIRQGGYAARVRSRDITARLQVHRVQFEGLGGLEAVRHAWNTAHDRGWAAPILPGASR